MKNNNNLDICEKLELFLKESTEVTTSTSPNLVVKMQELLSRVICANQYSKVLHWNSISTGEHLGYDHIYEVLDDVIDEFAEKYFMARNIAVMNPLERQGMFATGDFGDRLNEINALVEEICKDPDCDESMQSTVSGIGEAAQQCMGFYRQSVHDEQ